MKGPSLRVRFKTTRSIRTPMHPLSLRSATSTYHHRLRLRALRERRLDALGRVGLFFNGP